MAKRGKSATSTAPPPSPSPAVKPKAKLRLEIEGYPVEGISIGGHETCVIFPTPSLAFDIGRCPQRAVAQDFLFISHAHLDHIGGLPMYVATRGLYRLRPPTIFVPKYLRELVERLFDVHRAMDQSELKHTLIPLDVGEEYELRRDLKVRAFKTYHTIPSQGYVIYSVKQKLKQDYLGLPGSEIKRLKLSGVESTFLDDSVSIEHAREYGHIHLFEIANHSEKFENRAILLIHFSARYTTEEIDAGISRLPQSFRSRVYALKEGI